MSDTPYITQPERSMSLQPVIPDPNSAQLNLDDLDNVSLRNLREKKKQTDKAIEAVQARINYMKVKEESALKKVFNVRKRVTDIEKVRKTSSQLRQLQEAAQRRQQEEVERKSQFNKLLREHLDCNKKIVYTIMNEKIREDARKVRNRKQELELVSQTLRDNMVEDNLEKANRVRQDHLHLQEKKRMHFLEKLKTFKDIKEDQLRLQMKLREQHQQKIQELQQKEVMLLDRFNMSEKFKQKCEQEYQRAKEKYHSFYENTIMASRRNSLRDSKYSSNQHQPKYSSQVPQPLPQQQSQSIGDDAKCNIFIS